MTVPLRRDDIFPALRLNTLGAGPIALPDDVSGRFAAIVVFCAARCPLCRIQLREFQLAKSTLASLDTAVVAVSPEDAVVTARLALELDLSITLAHGAAARRLAALVGAPVHRGSVQPATILLDPAGAVLTATYSTGPIRRVSPEDVLDVVMRTTSTGTNRE